MPLQYLPKGKQFVLFVSVQDQEEILYTLLSQKVWKQITRQKNNGQAE